MSKKEDNNEQVESEEVDNNNNELKNNASPRVEKPKLFIPVKDHKSRIGAPRNFLSSALTARDDKSKDKDREKENKWKESSRSKKQQIKEKEEEIKEQLKLMGLEWKEGKKLKATRAYSQPTPKMQQLLASNRSTPSHLSTESLRNNNKLDLYEFMVFGVELDFLITRQKKIPEFSNLDVPNLVYQIVELLKSTEGFRTNGIFRLCGHHATQVFYENFIDKKGDYLFPFKLEHKNEVEIKEIDLNAKNNEIVNNNEENNNNNDDNDNNDGNNNVVNIEETIENENKSDFNEEVIAELNADNNGANNNNSNNNNSQEIKPKVKSDILPKLDIHTIGELLKSFLRRLPHPIIPRYPYFPYYIQFSAMSKVEARVASYAAMMKALPVNSYNLLKYLCSFFNLIAENKDVTLMNAINLGVIFAPCFFGSMDRDKDIDLSSIDHISMCKESKFTAEITADIILHQTEIFNDEVEAVKTFIAKDFIVLENSLQSIIRGDSILVIKKFTDRNTLGVIVGDGIWAEISENETEKFFEGIEEAPLSSLKRRPITSLFASKRMITAEQVKKEKKEERKRNAFSMGLFNRLSKNSNSSSSSQ